MALLDFWLEKECYIYDIIRIIENIAIPSPVLCIPGRPNKQTDNYTGMLWVVWTLLHAHQVRKDLGSSGSQLEQRVKHVIF